LQEAESKIAKQSEVMAVLQGRHKSELSEFLQQFRPLKSERKRLKRENAQLQRQIAIGKQSIQRLTETIQILEEKIPNCERPKEK
jgi:cell division protein FtsB